MLTKQSIDAFAHYILRSKDFDHIEEMYNIEPTPKLKRQCIEVLEELKELYGNLEDIEAELDESFSFFSNMVYKHTVKLNEFTNTN